MAKFGFLYNWSPVMFQKSDKGKMAREELDYDILREALAKMLEAEGRGALTRIHAEAKVSNVGRIVNGEIPAPSIDTWLKLHYRYPDYIPAPVLKGGEGDKQGKTDAQCFQQSGQQPGIRRCRGRHPRLGQPFKRRRKAFSESDY